MHPPNQELLRQRIDAILGVDTEAARFVNAAGHWFHGIDDIVDNREWPADQKIRNSFIGAALFSSNFYQQHAKELFPVIMLIANAYADSVEWEKSDVEWQRRQADVLRNCGNDILLAVVGIVGGYDAMREISLLVRENSHYRHHDERGNPI
jgi:hypothetical protein